MYLPQTSSVSLQDVKAHLLLMAAFQHIHEKVDQGGVRLNPTTGLPIPTSHAVLFFARSLQRFEAWIAALNPHAADPGLRDYEIPPPDVLMFLHAYMLSPLDFYEDSVKRHKVLSRVGKYPLSRTAALINEETLEFNPTAEQVLYWENATSLSFEIPFIGSEYETFSVTCPRCKTKASIPWAEVTVSESLVSISTSPEYPCADFKTECGICHLNITPSAIRTGRFLQDVHGGHIAHTVLDATGAAPDFVTARAASLQVAGVLGPNFMPQTAGDAFDWNLERVFEYLITRLEGVGDLHVKLADIKGAYSHPSDFAINLSDAVFRQARFIFQLSAMGWLIPRLMNDKDGVLIQAMKSYEQLLHVKMDGMIVRWDVDLIFHTHQLSGSKYRSDTVRIIGRVLDHDDKQPQDVILRAAEHAEAVWKKTFGQSYLAPRDPSLVSNLKKTVCGGSTGGACVVRSGGGGTGGGGQKGGGKGRVAAQSNRVVIVH